MTEEVKKMPEKAKVNKETKTYHKMDDGFRSTVNTSHSEAGRSMRKFSGRGAILRDEFETKLLDLTRVTRVTGGGKRLRFRAVVVAGDKKSKIGIGIDKGRDVSQAIDKAITKAKKNMMNIVIVQETIPHPVEAKFGPAVILLKPQKKGRGLVAGGVVRTICELAGIKNVSSKVLSRSKNKLNNARATIEALKKLKMKNQKSK